MNQQRHAPGSGASARSPADRVSAHQSQTPPRLGQSLRPQRHLRHGLLAACVQHGARRRHLGCDLHQSVDCRSGPRRGESPDPGDDTSAKTRSSSACPLPKRVVRQSAGTGGCETHRKAGAAVRGRVALRCSSEFHAPPKRALSCHLRVSPRRSRTRTPHSSSHHAPFTVHFRLGFATGMARMASFVTEKPPGVPAGDA